MESLDIVLLKSEVLVSPEDVAFLLLNGGNHTFFLEGGWGGRYTGGVVTVVLCFYGQNDRFRTRGVVSLQNVLL